MAEVEHGGGDKTEGSGHGDSIPGIIGRGESPYIISTNVTDIGPDGSGGDNTNTYSGATLNIGRIPVNGKKIIVLVTANASVTISTGRAQAISNTFVFNGSLKVDGGSITLIDSNGVSETFYGRLAATRSDEFVCHATDTTCATNFRTIVNASSLAITASGSGANIILTQDNYGAKGNTAITADSTFNGWCTTNPDAAFAGGSAVDLFCEFSPSGINAGGGYNSQWTNFEAHPGTVANVYDHTATNTTGVGIATDLSFVSGTTSAYQLDLTAVNAPYIRLGINSQGATLPEDTSVTLGIVYPAGYVRAVDRETWNEKGEREE